jgi:hypothetical protein
MVEKERAASGACQFVSWVNVVATLKNLRSLEYFEGRKSLWRGSFVALRLFATG